MCRLEVGPASQRWDPQRPSPQSSPHVISPAPSSVTAPVSAGEGLMGLGCADQTVRTISISGTSAQSLPQFPTTTSLGLPQERQTNANAAVATGEPRRRDIPAGSSHLPWVWMSVAPGRQFQTERSCSVPRVTEPRAASPSCLDLGTLGAVFTQPGCC